MKKLKIISLCFLISLLFIPKANASVVNHYTTLKYSETNLQLQEQYSDELDLIVDYVKQHGIGNISYSSGGDYVISIRTDQLASNNFNVTLFKYRGNSGDFYNIYRASDLTSSYVYMYISAVSQSMSIVNGSVVPLGSSSGYNSHFQWNYDTSCDPRSTDCIIYDNTHYFAYDYLDDTITMPLYNVTYNNPANIGIKIGDTDYSTGSNVPMKEFFDNISPHLPNPYKCTVNPDGFRTSSLSNISDFEYRITADNLSSEDYGIEGSFAFQNSSFALSDNNFNSSDYWEIEVIKGPDSVGEYNVNGVLSWDDTTKVLTVNYGVYATDSDPVKVDSIIKLKPKGSYAKDYFSGTLNYYSCNPTNPDIFLNDSYGYTDNTTGLTNSYDTSLMNFLKNTNNPDLNIFNNLSGLLPPGPVDSILTIPINMLYAINNWLMGENCTPVTINLPYVNQNIQLQCMRTFYTNIGANSFFEGVGTIASVVILVQYFVGLYNWVESHMQLSHQKFKAWGTGEL